MELRNMSPAAIVEELGGVVEFIATGIKQQQTVKLHEISRFVKVGGSWLYVDGDIQQGNPWPDSGKAKIGRNGPCPCGSGRKFKKCCM